MKRMSAISRSLACTAALLVGGSALACMDNPFYPIAEGASWTYNSSDGSAYTQSVVALDADSFTMRIEVGGTEPMDIKYLCDEEGVLSMASMESMLPEDVEMEIVSADGITYPNDLSVGQTWSSETVMRTEMTMEGIAATMTMTVTTDSRVESMESVTVPAGTFNALLLNADSTVTSVTEMMGMSVPFTVETTSSSWLVEGIGMVLTTSEDGTRMELVSYTIP